MDRKLDVQKTRCTESQMYRKLDGQKARGTESWMDRKPDVQKTRLKDSEEFKFNDCTTLTVLPPR